MAIDIDSIGNRAKRAHDWVQGYMDDGSLLPLSVRHHFEHDMSDLLAEVRDLRGSRDRYYRLMEMIAEALESISEEEHDDLPDDSPHAALRLIVAQRDEARRLAERAEDDLNDLRARMKKVDLDWSKAVSHADEAEGATVRVARERDEALAEVDRLRAGDASTASYVVSVEGCDDGTYVTVDLTAAQHEFVVDLAAKVSAESNCQCMPTMSVKPYEGGA